MNTIYNKSKQVGKFIISYLNRREVSISYKGYLSNLATQMLTHEMVDGLLTHTGTFSDLPFEGAVYPGIVFKKPFFMSRKKLECLLENIE